MLSTDHTPQAAGGGVPAEHPTHSLSAAHPHVVDAYSLLDHRTRALTIPAAGAPAGRYLAVDAGAETRLIALDRPVVHLGRGLVADVRLEDPHVSRRHAIVASRADGVRILDDRSSAGTWVNGQAVTVAWLCDGDVVRLGRAALRYVEVAPDPATRWTPRTRPSAGAPLRPDQGRAATTAPHPAHERAGSRGPGARRAAARPPRRFPVAPARPRRPGDHAEA